MQKKINEIWDDQGNPKRLKLEHKETSYAFMR